MSVNSNSQKLVLECPECQTQNEAESVNSFPKNLALLNMNPNITPTPT